jgi:putative oxygen-independent coproporphyrinogen III oxidase
MPSVPLDGDPVPADGALPSGAFDGAPGRDLGFYVHVPFCATRCGYCDFNTYTAEELRRDAGSGPVSVSRDGYDAVARAEVDLARRVLAGDARPVRTVFFGGGTPTLLGPEQLGAVLARIDERFGLAADAEVTTEANPETLDPEVLARLREQGITRISLGMQSARGHVLRVLERTHTPGRAQQCVRWAHEAGFEHVSLDLIYGAPGESDEDWRRSLEAAIEAGPDHLSAYSLIVEEGTRLAARVRRGELPMPDDDVLAERYLIADALMADAGFAWYEVSNWARGPEARCRHNLLYWRGGDWWGVGPGAHSHVGGTRWWNVKHPAAYAARLDAGSSPGQAREVLDDADRRFERIMLQLRLAEGLPLELLDTAGQQAAEAAGRDGRRQAAAAESGRAALTRRGRLLADAVVRNLT